MLLRLLIATGLLAAAACVPVPTPPVVTLEEPPSAALQPLEAGEAIAVLPSLVPSREAASETMAECVRNRLAEGLRRNRVLSADEARDAFFPWLEPSQVPRADPAVQAFVARAAVAQKLRELRLRYLVAVDLSTAEGEPVVGELLVAGAGFGKDSARLAARIVDLEDACCRPGGAARATGLRGYAHVMIYGVIVLSSLQEPACGRLSSALVEALEPAAAKAP